ncbi:MAG: PIN domain-containing protein [Planctomycetaceae bacterium]|nr:PIN domain-containing protein [Planctomycetaceae bacterium]
MIFVDTGAWFAAFEPNDPDHADADAWLTANGEHLVTTDYILDELLALLKIRVEFARALRLGNALRDGSVSLLEWVTPADFDAAWEVFSTFRDKGWSFTDCTSRVVMQRLSVGTAFSFDTHFRQFGDVAVVPQVSR